MSRSENLRRKAEAVLADRATDPVASEPHLRDLIRELNTYQIELEMQNAQLRAAEEALEASCDRYAELYDSAPIGYLSISLEPEGEIIEANLRAAKLLRVERSQLVGRRFETYVLPEDLDDYYVYARQLGPSQPRAELELRIKPDGAEPIWVALESAHVIAPDGQRHHRMVVSDVSERRRVQEEDARTARLAALGLTAGGIAHDFNNLLMVIAANIDLASASGAAGLEPLEDAKKACGRAAGLAKQLLTFARGGEPQKQRHEVSALVEPQVQLAARGSSVRCTCALAADLPPVMADETQVGQVVHNLVLNAVQASNPGGAVEVSATARTLSDHQVAALPAGDYIEIRVRDRGVGIAAESLPHIFDPYFTTKISGSGLGLATAYSIMQRHGGALTVESQVGTGATLRAYLPVGAVSAAVPQSDDARASVPVRPGIRVLVMDDEPYIRRAMGRMLGRFRCETLFAADGADALALLKRAQVHGKPIELALLDLTIPGGMGGLAAMRALRVIDPTCKIAVMSGYSDDPVLSDAAAHGFDAALVKPFGIGAVEQLLVDLMAA